VLAVEADRGALLVAGLQEQEADAVAVGVLDKRLQERSSDAGSTASGTT
jgi:hypothetical protein